MIVWCGKKTYALVEFVGTSRDFSLEEGRILVGREVRSSFSSRLEQGMKWYFHFGWQITLYFSFGAGRGWWAVLGV